MEHVAIMRKSWGLTDKILSGQKKIESRWYKTWFGAMSSWITVDDIAKIKKLS